MSFMGDLFGGSDDSATKAQRRDNAAVREFAQEQMDYSRERADELFPQSDYARNQGYQAALDLYANSIPEQARLFQNGNVAAQTAQLAGLDQFNNAILGKPVDMSGFKPYVSRTQPTDAERFVGIQPGRFDTSRGTQQIFTQNLPNFDMSQQQQQPQQQQQQQINPMQAYNTYNNLSGLMGGGSAPAAVGEFGTGQAVGSLYGNAGGGMGGGFGTITQGGAGGGGMGGMFGGGGGGLAGAGPWAALAAAVIANESEAEKAGRRDKNRGSRAIDMLSGAALEQDMDYYGDKVGGVGGDILKTVGQLGNPEGTWNLLKGLF